MKNRGVVLICGLVILAAACSARADYIANFSTMNLSNDFQYAMVGSMGAPTGVHNQAYIANNSLRLEGRYAQQACRYLKVGGDVNGLNDGNYTHSVTASVMFAYYNGDSTNVAVILGMRSWTNSGANNIPTYRAVINDNTFAIHKEYAYQTYNVLDTYSLTNTLGSGNAYKLAFAAVDTATNQYGDIVELKAALFENNVLIGTLHYLDTPSNTSKFPPFNSYGEGYIGIAAGSTTNSGISRGINVTAFSVRHGVLLPSLHRPGGRPEVGLKRSPVRRAAE
jgi:hypothetical protein